MMTPSRRGFLAGLVSILAAPPIVRVASLMPVKAAPIIDAELIVNPPLVLTYREEFIRAFDTRPGSITWVQDVVQQLATRPDGQIGVEMRHANGKVDFIPMSARAA